MSGKRLETGESSRASGPLLRVDHWLGRKGQKRAENWGKWQSQWSTLKSGPLARAERLEKGRKLGKVAEPVVHFKEWTTSWGEKAGKGPETGESSRASGPL